MLFASIKFRAKLLVSGKRELEILNITCQCLSVNMTLIVRQYEQVIIVCSIRYQKDK